MPPRHLATLSAPFDTLPHIAYSDTCTAVVDTYGDIACWYSSTTRTRPLTVSRVRVPAILIDDIWYIFRSLIQSDVLHVIIKSSLIITQQLLHINKTKMPAYSDASHRFVECSIDTRETFSHKLKPICKIVAAVGGGAALSATDVGVWVYKQGCRYKQQSQQEDLCRRTCGTWFACTINHTARGAGVHDTPKRYWQLTWKIEDVDHRQRGTACRRWHRGSYFLLKGSH